MIYDTRHFMFDNNRSFFNFVSGRYFIFVNNTQSSIYHLLNINLHLGYNLLHERFRHLLRYRIHSPNKNSDMNSWFLFYLLISLMETQKISTHPNCRVPSTALQSMDSAAWFTQAPPKSPEMYAFSTDFGKTWQSHSTGLPADAQFSRLLSYGNKMFMTTSAGLFFQTRPDEAWTKDPFFPEGFQRLIPGLNGLYAIGQNGKIHFSQNGTSLWIPVYGAIQKYLPYSILEISNQELIALCEAQALRSTDHGQSWEPMPPLKNFQEVILHDQTLFATSNRLMRSDDHGQHWKTVLHHDDMNGSLKVLNDQLIMVFNGYPRDAKHPQFKCALLYHSTDRGKTWQRMESNLPPSISVGDFLQFGKLLFCSIDSGVYSSMDQGKTWELVYPFNSAGWIELNSFGTALYLHKIQGC